MTYAIKMVKAGTGLLNKVIGEAGHDGPTVIAARPGVHYVLTQIWDANSDHKGAPKKLVTLRVGNDLHIAIDARDASTPDLVIRGYFAYAPAPVTGVGPSGEAFEYGMLDTKAPLGGTVTSDSAIAAAGNSATLLTDTGLLVSGPFPALGAMGQVALAGAGLLAVGSITRGSGDSSTGTGNTGEASAAAAQAAIAAYAKSSTARVPALSDFTALGVTGVTSSNLAPINTALDALTDASVNSKSQVQGVVDAYARVLAAAKSSSSNWVASGSDPTAADLLKIGAAIGIAGMDGQSGHATDARQAAALNLLDSTIARLAASALDSVTKVNDLYKAVDKLMLLAKGSEPSDALSKDDLAALGVTGASADNLGVIVDGIKASSDDGSGIGSVKLLQAVVSQFVIAAYADQDSNPAPTLQDYLNIGVISHVDNSNLNAVNDAIRTLNKADVDTASEVQTVVDAYRKILSDAKGAADSSGRASATDPTLSDFRAIGITSGRAVTAGGAQQAAALNLLDDTLIRKTSNNVDTVDEINNLVKTIDKVMALAAGSDPAIALTAAELTTLGITNVGVDNLNAIAQQIKTSDDSGSGVDTLQELQAVVSLGTILGYANNSNSGTAPTLLDYSNIGIHNSGISSSNVGAINSVIHGLAQTSLDSGAKIDAVITAWDHILTSANGSIADVMPAPLASDYAAIGIGTGTMLANTTIGHDSTHTLGTAALALLDSAIGLKQRTQLTTLSSITDLEHIVEKVMTQANVLNSTSTSTFENVSGLVSRDLVDLGVLQSGGILDTSSTGSSSKWGKFISVLSNSSIDDVNSIDKLQALANSQAVLNA